MIGIADTGFLIAVSMRRDRYFRWAAALVTEIREPLLTCEAVLAELSFQMQDSGHALDLLESGLIRLSFSGDEHRRELAEMAQRYAHRKPDFADLCLIRMSELNPRHPVLTVDGDFRVYRRNRREVIPLLMPPELVQEA